MKNLIKAGVAIAISTFTWNYFTPKAEAFKLRLSDNNVTMIEDLEFKNTLYDVHFFYGSPAELFNPENPYSEAVIFSTQGGRYSDAVLALETVTSALNSVNPAPLAGGYKTFVLPLYKSDDFITILIAGLSENWGLEYRSAGGEPRPLPNPIRAHFGIFIPAEAESETVPEPQGIIGLLLAAGLGVTVKRKVCKV
ncbi:MAG TPA: PEP-CTERM sorting domain-containing protein [Nostocaceae cyanobacterium]|nr:PEP-CTERM sorting domain-containing protein [Nostocaceae cyanobacterium]